MDPFLFLDGNPAWLDFVNTKLILDGTPTDLLRRFADLPDWLRRAGLLDAHAAARAGRDWADDEAALRRAKEFRSILHGAAERLGHGESFPPAAIQAVNDLLASVAGSYRLLHGKKGFELRFDSAPRRSLDLLEPLARSVGEFLTRADLGRVKKCGNPKRVLFFYDATKNQARRWCSMALCGNRMKAAAHYQRWKGSRDPS